MVMTLIKPKAKSRWTLEELEYLKASYGKIPNKEIYAHLWPRTPTVIKTKANSFGLKDVSHWREEDLEFLNENYGSMSDEKICRRLKRTPAALHIQAVRKLKICHKTNFYTAREVANILGVACSKTITSWMRRGWIEGEKSTIRCGGGLMWNFQYEAIENLLRTRPWMFTVSKMELSYFRSIVKEEFEKDPWFSYQKTCALIHVAYCGSAMASYIKKKWLHPMKKPIEGGNHWTWIFRKSDIDHFLADDPRRLRPLLFGATKRRWNFKKGNAVRVVAIWKLRCPKCKKTVRISTSSTRLESPAIKSLFIKKYNHSEACDHGYLCQVEKELKPYKTRKTREEKGEQTRSSQLRSWPVSKRD